jgi:hypothetical protein
VILGFSLVRKRVYVDVARLRDYFTLRRYRREGYEVVELGDVPRYTSFITSRKLCSGPALYTARHCFGLPVEGVEGRGYTIRETGEVGHVAVDYSPPLHNIVVWLARWLGFQLGGVKDVVKVTKTRIQASDQVATVTGSIPGTGYALLTAVPSVDPVSLVDRDVHVINDVSGDGQFKCTVIDYGIIDIYTNSVPWPHEVLVARCERPIVPGDSGAPVIASQASS